MGHIFHSYTAASHLRRDVNGIVQMCNLLILTEASSMGGLSMIDEESNTRLLHQELLVFPSPLHTQIPFLCPLLILFAYSLLFWPTFSSSHFFRSPTQHSSSLLQLNSSCFTLSPATLMYSSPPIHSSAFPPDLSSPCFSRRRALLSTGRIWKQCRMEPAISHCSACAWDEAAVGCLFEGRVTSDKHPAFILLLNQNLCTDETTGSWPCKEGSTRVRLLYVCVSILLLYLHIHGQSRPYIQR